jgi:hypothetical protein
VQELTAWARLHDDDHWLSDTVAAGLLGYAIGRWAVHHRGLATIAQGTVTPQIAEGRIGALWERRF